MAQQGWKRLLAGVSAFRGPGQFPLAAYSEFMPPPRMGRKPYGAEDPVLFRDDDPLGWQVTEYEEVMELRPGLEHLGVQLVRALEHLGNGRPAHGIARAKLEGNPYWPDELANRAGRLPHERYVVIAPLALSRTQDDKGRVRWTLFGGSEQGPSRAFWKGFFTAPGREIAAEEGLGFFRRLLAGCYGESPDPQLDLCKAGFRVLPEAEKGTGPICRNGPEGAMHKLDLSPFPNCELPSWIKPFLLTDEKRLRGVRYLLTFRPFGSLPAAIRRAYLAGELHLLPFPGSLVFWGAPPFVQLQRELPLAMQIPLLHMFPRHDHPYSLRVPQAGWLHEPGAEKGTGPICAQHPEGRSGKLDLSPFPRPDPERLPLRNTYHRTHRWAKVLRDEDELGVAGGEDRVAHVLFSTAADDLGLYGKPMARNAQIWTHDFRLLLDGPRADGAAIERAAAALREGGHFGYRFLFPAMQVGRHEVYWHRPLVAFLGANSSAPEVLPHAPLGYLTAYSVDRPRLDRAVELWPRLLARRPHVAALYGFLPTAGHEHHTTLHNARKVLDAYDLWDGGPLPADFARALLMAPKHETLEQWLCRVETRAGHPVAGAVLAEGLRQRIASGSPLSLGAAPGVRATGSGQWPVVSGQRIESSNQQSTINNQQSSNPQSLIPNPSLTFHRTATRRFEVAYWRTIARLAHGKYINKDNADCARDRATQSLLKHQHRDLEALGNYLLDYYRRTVGQVANLSHAGQVANLSHNAIVGDLPFRWQTDMAYPWSGGWLGNQEGREEERDLLVMIPGRDRRRAVIMADHYDTAYMEDRYEKARGGNGVRLAAAGADDNHSATAALMLAAPIFMELSQAGRLACDVWLVHLTGEEFPSDCMGARHLARSIVEGDLRVRLQNGRRRDLSKVQIEGVYVLDMIAHNNEHDRDVFQISPGVGRESLRLAYHAHAANAAWNACAPAWNRRAGRVGQVANVPHDSPHPNPLPKGEGTMRNLSCEIPATAPHPVLYGEVRTPDDPRSSLYNTDGQIFSDAGIPAVLFMENYDINRVGYHDTHDTMANIDLDYGAAVAAIAIETVARAAAERR